MEAGAPALSGDIGVGGEGYKQPRGTVAVGALA